MDWQRAKFLYDNKENSWTRCPKFSSEEFRIHIDSIKRQPKKIIILNGKKHFLLLTQVKPLVMKYKATVRKLLSLVESLKEICTII